MVHCAQSCEGTARHDHGALKYVPCRLSDCGTCAHLLKRARGVAVFKRIGGVATSHYVVTLPAAWRHLVGLPQVLYLRDRVKAVLAAWAFEVDGVERGWIAHLHPTGSADENEDQTETSPYARPDHWEWAPHFHVASPCVGLTSDGELYDLPTFRPLSDLERLRELWQAELDTFAEAHCVPYEPSNVHYSYRLKAGHRLHRLAYDMRPFPDWNASGELGALKTYVSWGLCAPNRHAAGIETWREVVAGDLSTVGTDDSTDTEPTVEQIREGRRCAHCGGPMTLGRLVDVGGVRWSQLRRMGVPILDEYGRDPPPRPPRPSARAGVPAWSVEQVGAPNDIPY